MEFKRKNHQIPNIQGDMDQLRQQQKLRKEQKDTTNKTGAFSGRYF